MGKFDGKVVIVTGASQGIGAVIAVAFAKEGAKLAIHGRNEEKLNETAKLCEDEGAEVLKIIADLTKFENLEKVIQQTVERFSVIYILINNAGNPQPFRPIEKIELEGYEYKFRLNLRAPVFLSKYALPHLKKTKGCIVSVSSIASTQVLPEFAEYAMTKSALDNFTRYLAAECVPFGVRVNTINPAKVDTPLVFKNRSEEEAKMFSDMMEKSHPFGLIHPKTVAEGILYLCSCPNVTGTSLVIDSGSSYV